MTRSFGQESYLDPSGGSSLPLGGKPEMLLADPSVGSSDV